MYAYRSTNAFSTVTTRPDCEPITTQRLVPFSQLIGAFSSSSFSSIAGRARQSAT